MVGCKLSSHKATVLQSPPTSAVSHMDSGLCHEFALAREKFTKFREISRDLSALAFRLTRRTCLGMPAAGTQRTLVGEEDQGKALPAGGGAKDQHGCSPGSHSQAAAVGTQI